MSIHIPEQMDGRLISMLVIGHGHYPLGIKSALEMITGDTRNIAYLCFEEGDDPDMFGDQIRNVIDRAPCGCIVLIDLMGGTPFNQFFMNMPGSGCQAVCGANLAMALEVASAREYATLEELAQIAVDAGNVGIVDVYKKRDEKRNK